MSLPKTKATDRINERDRSERKNPSASKARPNARNELAQKQSRRVKRSGSLEYPKNDVDIPLDVVEDRHQIESNN